VTSLVALGFTINNLFLVMGGHRAEAEVTAIVPVKTGETVARYETIVAFMDKRGNRIQTVLNDAPVIRYKVGERLPVIYREGTRRVGQVVKVDDFWTIWGGALIMSGVAVATIIGVYLFTSIARRR
jgi:hypothetical protein